MHQLRTDTSLLLPMGELLSWTPDRMLHLQVQSGRVWLTITGDPQDYWLRAGAQMQLPAGQKIVMEADHAATRFLLTGLCDRRAVSLPSFDMALVHPVVAAC